MRLATSLALGLAAAGAIGLSCAGLSTAEPMSDPAGSGASTFAPGTVGNLCSMDQEGCQWQANACEADPVCAKWYACVLGKPLNIDVMAAINSCATAPMSSSQKKLVDCLLGSTSCKDLAPQPGEMKEAGEGPILPDDNGEGGALSTPGCVDEAVEDAGVAVTSACTECVYSCCSGMEGEDLTTCYHLKHSGACWVEQTEQRAIETCLHTNQQGDGGLEFNADVHLGLVKLGVMACYLDTCSDKCAAPSYRDCVACQRSCCLEKFNAFTTNADAQDFKWCRSYCDFGNPPEGAAACQEACKQKYPVGAQILGALIGCRVANCANSCAGEP